MINKSLRFVGISHKKATVSQREVYHIPEDEMSNLATSICANFKDITGLFILATCNRTEIYFESLITPSSALLDFFINLKVHHSAKINRQLFDHSDSSQETAKHLLDVSSGLKSSVIGDAEIICQIKKAYQFSVLHGLQGSLLERAMQSVFKSHKRISNETHFRDGTTSIAYKSLKIVNSTYGKVSAKEKKILLIGAGEIVKQLFKYSSKFNFNNIYISNRTKEKAIALANKYNCKVFNWGDVLINNLQEFDVIIGAASNCNHLINKMPIGQRMILLIDLTIPSIINKKLAQNKNITYYDLDTLSTKLEDTKEKRCASIDKVNEVIDEELVIYNQWLQKAPFRASLLKYKKIVGEKIESYFNTSVDNYDHQIASVVANRVLRKLIAQKESGISPKEIDAIIVEQISSLEKLALVPS